MIRILKKSHRPIREKWIAIFVCAVFFTTSVFLPQSNAAMSKIPIAAHRSLTDDLTAIALPEGIGKIQETYRGTSDEIVVLIQDAHSIPDAQRSIRSVIDHFQTTYGVSLVGVEGASEKLDSQIFRSFPDQELLRKTLESYAERGELTGGTASALFNAFPAAYYGVEDGPLYEKGISYYFKAIELEPEIMARVGSMVSALNHEKEAVYSKELLEIDRLLIDFGNNKADLLRVLSKLGRYQPPSKGSELAVLLEEIQSNSRSETGTSEIQNEVKKIAEQVVSVLKRQPPSPKTRQELGEYYAKFQGFQTSGMTSQAFALYLKDAAKKHKMNIRVSPELDGLVDHQKKLKDIEGTRLFAEFKRYADAVTEKLIGESLPGTQGLIRQLDAETKGLELVRRLARLELTFGDWEKIRKLKLRSDRWAAFQDDVVLRDEVSPLLGKMEPHLDFYRVAEQRDQVFLKNIQSVMRKQNKTSALLVAGGFHTEGLTQTFKAKGISYVLVTPKIGSVPKESFYREHMQGQVSWSNYFEIKDGKVNLYDAFVRATRDKLIRSQGEKNAVLHTLDPVLKNWRDQILRDLSADGRITQASEYTRFLDELSRSPRSQASSLKKKWLANIDHFGEGLRKLQGEGHLSEFSILQLIKTITAAELATSNALAVNARVDRRLLPSIQRPELRRESKKTRSEMRTEMKSAIQNLQGIQIAALENGDLLPVIEAAVRKGFGGIEVPRSHIGGSGRLKDYIDLMERGETVIKDPPAPFETDFGSIDLSKLNDVTRYEGYDASAQLARDIHIAHLLGFITIDPFNGVSPRTLTYQLLKRKKIKISNESSPWPIWIVLKNRFQKMIETGDAKKYQGQEGHVRFFKEVFKNKAVELHAGNLFTAISDIVPKELGWQKINCNLGEVLALRQDFIEKLAEPGWVSAHRGDGQQIEYYVQLFGNKAI